MSKSKKKILIIFPDEWLSYSPTVLNLTHILSQSFDVRGIAVHSRRYKGRPYGKKDFEFVSMPIPAKNMLLWRDLYKIIKAYLLLKRVRAFAQSNKVDEAVGVDSLGLWIAQKVFETCHFVSLELQKDLFFRLSKAQNIESVVIQTQERLFYLFDHPLRNTFYVQNAPLLSKAHPSAFQDTVFNGKMVYLGHVQPSHGVYTYLDTVEQIGDETITLTMKGIFPRKTKASITRRYGRLIEKGRVILDESYTPQQDIVAYLSNFSIGLCCYDLKVLGKRDFNYLSSPSGKLFNCYAAGVPVIGSEILGLRSVNDFKTGVLLPRLSVGEMKKAIGVISQHYGHFRKNCFKAAKHFDFEKAVEPYKRYLSEK